MGGQVTRAHSVAQVNPARPRESNHLPVLGKTGRRQALITWGKGKSYLHQKLHLESIPSPSLPLQEMVGEAASPAATIERWRIHLHQLRWD